MSDASSKDETQSSPYRVLARKYRPGSFDELVGQDPLVRTLTNAISSGRIAQAFMLTGVRGVGKTTVARLIAKCLNASNGPTIEPDRDCEHCRAIAEDRHPDVIEMDAASRTGVNDIRELIEGVRYKPTTARYKVYILDEVHMLSTPAFNALLKTLEEPPEHVKFIFATTEIRKVPVTVLSRCQRFDLRRIPMDQLADHFRKVARLEGVDIEDDALAMIARAADGSARDGLSILDQAIVLAGDKVSGEIVQNMLGLADRATVFDLFDALMRGDAAKALEQLQDLYELGTDPLVVIQDLLDVAYWLTRVKLAPAIAERPGVPEVERVRGKAMAADLRISVLSRAWQILLRGLGEVQIAPNPLHAAEMVLIRLIHAADLKAPAELVKELTGAPAATSESQAPAPGAGMEAVAAGGGARAEPVPAKQTEPQPDPDPTSSALAEQLISFRAMVDCLKERREALLYTNLYRHAHAVRFERGRIEVRKTDSFPSELLGRLGQILSEWTGERWVVLHAEEPGEPTLYEQDHAIEEARLTAAADHPVVQAVLQTFPGAAVTKVVDRTALPLSGDDPDLGAPDEDEEDDGL